MSESDDGAVSWVRLGTWWVRESDGTEIRRIGRDTVLVRRAGRDFHVGCEIGSPGSLAVFDDDVESVDGEPMALSERREVAVTLRRLLDLSGDPWESG